MPDKELLRDYARLIVKIGVNLQRDQILVVNTPLTCAPFARLLAEEAYRAGAHEVVMSWKDDFLTRERYLHADDAVFDEVADWQRHFFNDYAREGAAYAEADAFFGGQKVWQSFSDWLAKVPAVNYGVFTNEVDTAVTAHLPSLGQGANIDDVLKAIDSQAQGQIQ